MEKVESVRGDDYRKLLTREYEELLQYAIDSVEYLTRSLETYPHTADQAAVRQKEIRLYELDIEIYTQALAHLKGAENETTNLTEANSESPAFQGITCITVL